MVRTSFPEIGAEHMLQSLTAGYGTKNCLGARGISGAEGRRSYHQPGDVAETALGLQPTMPGCRKPRSIAAPSARAGCIL